MPDQFHTAQHRSGRGQSRILQLFVNDHYDKNHCVLPKAPLPNRLHVRIQFHICRFNDISGIYNPTGLQLLLLQLPRFDIIKMVGSQSCLAYFHRRSKSLPASSNPIRCFRFCRFVHFIILFKTFSLYPYCTHEDRE